MIFSRRNRSAAPAVLIEQKPRDLVMTPILGDLDPAVAVPFPICGACVKQDTYPQDALPALRSGWEARRSIRHGSDLDRVPSALKSDGMACRGGRNQCPKYRGRDQTPAPADDHASIHIGFEPGPAMESVRPSKHELSIVQGEFL